MTLTCSNDLSPAEEIGADNDREAIGDMSASHFRPSSFLSSAEHSELAMLNVSKLVAALAVDFLVVALAVWVAETYRHPLVYLVAIMAIGARQAGIGSIALHDGVHHMLLKNRRWNDRLGRFLGMLVFTPLVASFSSYRQSHFGHHRATNKEDDPDILLTESFYRVSRLKAVIGFLITLSGILFVAAVARYPFRYGRTNPLGAIGLIVGVALLIAGWTFEVYAAQLFVWYWVLPLATWGIFVNQLRTLAEHYPENEFGRDKYTPELFRTRDIICSWFDSCFIVTRGVNYHLSHHLCPQVPFYNLVRLQSKLADSASYRRFSHVTYGYHRVLCEYCLQRSDYVGQLQSSN